ncbi:MAG: putative lipid II flippase FtsW [Anaerovoracaceae bacterium]|nr:putative lipid II flippase FtsW [Bacillota bacterium]MEE0517152.1 putative lipid II flippase FtsW [Anaerovoracaceae bacterium]
MRKAKERAVKSEQKPKKVKEKKAKVKKEKKPRRHFTFLPEGKTGDLWLILLTVILVTFGTVMIFSASYYKSISEAGDPYVYLKRQLMWLVAGFIAMWLLAKIDYHIWGKLYKVIPVLCAGLLLMTFTPLGVEVNGATRWIDIGPITIMPGEVAKLGLIIFVAGYFDRYPKRAFDFWKGVVPVVLLAGIYAGIIMLQPNMSTAFTVVFIAGGMLIVAGVKWRHMCILAGTAGIAGVGLILIDTEGYRFARFISFLDPFADALGDGWQVVQSLLAMGTGGLTGRGLGNSIQKNLYLPEPQNDFILAIIGEELGFVGILALMCVYMLLIWRGCHLAINAPDYMGMMMAAGITIMIGIQVVMNIAVVTSSFPPTGVILPFVSYGGNALMIFMGAMGVLLNISKSSDL